MCLNDSFLFKKISAVNLQLIKSKHCYETYFL